MITVDVSVRIDDWVDVSVRIGDYTIFGVVDVKATILMIYPLPN